jgi:asparagine synthase (glutamine-hydrolysing)
MRCRGFDTTWSSQDRRCAFGDCSLLSKSATGIQPQPAVSHDGRFAITFDGTIFNYPELRKTLEIRGISFRSNAYVEALMHLYALEGAAMPKRLHGSFAFAIWDNFRHELFVARDPFGSKPLYYANDGWTFRFASQVKALLAGGNISTDLEPAGVAGFYLWGHVPEPFTIYRKIRALPAGHTMIVDRLAPRDPKPYARIAETLAQGALPTKGTDPLESVREAVVESVQHQLRADFDLGIFFSGGVVSGSLMALMHESSHRSFRAITVDFEELNGRSGEAFRAAEIARLCGAQHVVRRVTAREIHSDWPAILDAMDQPSANGIKAWFLAKAAREQEVHIALSGFGAGAVLGGWASFRDPSRSGPQYGLWDVMVTLAGSARILIPTFVSGHLNGFSCWTSFDCCAYLAQRSLFPPREILNLMEPRVARDGLRRLKPIHRLRSTVSPDPGTRDARILAFELSHSVRDQLLRDLDWAGRAHGIEIRTPLVDDKLVQKLGPILKRSGPGEVRRAFIRIPKSSMFERQASAHNCRDFRDGLEKSLGGIATPQAVLHAFTSSPLVRAT